MKILANERLKATIPNYEEDLDNLGAILKRAFPSGKLKNGRTGQYPNFVFTDFNSDTIVDVQPKGNKVVINIDVEFVDVEAFGMGNTLAQAWNDARKSWIYELKQEDSRDAEDLLRKVIQLRTL